MKKKFIGILLCATMLATVMVGCGAPKETSSTDKPADTAETAEPTESAEPTGEKLVYWSMWEPTEPQGQAIGEAVKAFSAETGIEVDE